MSETEENQSLEEKVRIDVLAQRMTILFGFCADLIPDIDLLEKAAKTARDRESLAFSAAPLLGAAGMDHNQINAEWNLRRRRSEALVELLKVLRDTETEREERLKSNAGKAIMEKQLKDAFGL